MSIWFRQFTLDEVRNSSTTRWASISAPISWTSGRTTSRRRCRWITAPMQPDRILHGGASVALAEPLAARRQMCIDRARLKTVGQEINANHLRPATSGQVTGRASLLFSGPDQVWNIDVADDHKRLICVSRLTIAILEDENGPPVERSRIAVAACGQTVLYLDERIETPVEIRRPAARNAEDRTKEEKGR